jgi:hypothetical protein
MERGPSRRETMIRGQIRRETIEGVPAEEVGRLTQDFRDSGAVEVTALPNQDGTWRVVAFFNLSTVPLEHRRIREEL